MNKHLLQVKRDWVKKTKIIKKKTYKKVAYQTSPKILVQHSWKDPT